MGQIIQLAKLNKWLVYHTYDSRRSTAGFPDLVLVRDERLIFAELKVGARKPTAEQHKWLGALDLARASTFVWRPCDWPTIQHTLLRV